MKLPHKLYKNKNVIAIGHYAIYGVKFLQVGPIFNALQKRDMTTGIPCMGKITVKGKSYWFCRYGFLNDPDIYAKKIKKRKKVKA